jgi:hypothetical protein
MILLICEHILIHSVYGENVGISLERKVLVDVRKSRQRDAVETPLLKAVDFSNTVAENNCMNRLEMVEPKDLTLFE